MHLCVINDDYYYWCIHILLSTYMRLLLFGSHIRGSNADMTLAVRAKPVYLFCRSLNSDLNVVTQTPLSHTIMSLRKIQ